AYVAGIGANRILGARLASFVGLTEVLFAILFAWLVLGELPTLVQFFGGVLILAGVTLVRVDELRPGRNTMAPAPPRPPAPVPSPRSPRAVASAGTVRPKSGQGPGEGRRWRWT